MFCRRGAEAAEQERGGRGERKMELDEVMLPKWVKLSVQPELSIWTLIESSLRHGEVVLCSTLV